MSKFGWSYPPGVSERDLPGNSPAEQRIEALTEKIFDILEATRTADPNTAFDDAAVKFLDIISDAYIEGRDDARGDDMLVRDLQPSPIHDYEEFIKERNLEADYALWLSTQPMRS